MGKSRLEAGRCLAEKLMRLRNENPVVFAIPRGGLPVAAEIAGRLDAPLELILMREIGTHFQAKLAIGAVVDGPTPTLILFDDMIYHYSIPKDHIDRARQKALAEIEWCREIYLNKRRPISVKGRAVIVVDDGSATGANIEAALKAMHKQDPEHIILALPVAAGCTIDRLRPLVDEIICLETLDDFWAGGFHCRDFNQLSDRDVVKILKAYEASHPQVEVTAPAKLSELRDLAPTMSQQTHELSH